MHTLVTMGAQHQGVMNVPECWNPSFNMTPSVVCMAMQKLVGLGAYFPYIRDHLVQAQYFKVWQMCRILDGSLCAKL
jgi:palmitoyl-protein thioesterase